MIAVRFAAFCFLVASAAGAGAARLEVALRVPLQTVREALTAQLAASPAGAYTLYREGRCRFFNLEAPNLASRDGQLHFTGTGSAALGVELAGRCQNAATWRGTMEFVLVPQIDPAGRLRLRIVDSTLTDASGAGTAGFIWELSKRQVHPRLERATYDFGTARSALLAILREAAPSEQRAAMEGVVQSLQVLQPRVESAHVVVPVAIDVPDAWQRAPAPARVSSAPLTEAELEALEQALQPWDAFLAYSIKQLALDNADEALRRRLFTLLLESRYQLVAILSGEAPSAGDPVRALFVDAWNELRGTLADSQRHALFLDAGDALLALDRAAPGLGMTLSAEGLRQLARSLHPPGRSPHPSTRGDPLAYDWAVDPQLRQLFQVQDLAATPPGRSWLEFFLRHAHAADDSARSLDRWVPARHELAHYEARVGDLLHKTAAAELQRGGLPARYQTIYRHMVPTTALIESCWRQYVARGGKVAYLRSAAGSVGIMQINQHVWRGFYDVQRLRWDTAYNTRAGAQILMRYVKDYAIPYAETSGDPDHVPRAAYAVYNAGPRAVGRFNKPAPHPREQRVDDHLWTLYQGIASGGQADLATCSVRHPKTAVAPR